MFVSHLAELIVSEVLIAFRKVVLTFFLQCEASFLIV